MPKYNEASGSQGGNKPDKAASASTRRKSSTAIQPGSSRVSAKSGEKPKRASTNNPVHEKALADKRLASASTAVTSSTSTSTSTGKRRQSVTIESSSEEDELAEEEPESTTVPTPKKSTKSDKKSKATKKSKKADTPNKPTKSATRKVISEYVENAKKGIPVHNSSSAVASDESEDDNTNNANSGKAPSPAHSESDSDEVSIVNHTRDTRSSQATRARTQASQQTQQTQPKSRSKRLRGEDVTDSDDPAIQAHTSKKRSRTRKSEPVKHPAVSALLNNAINAEERRKSQPLPSPNRERDGDDNAASSAGQAPPAEASSKQRQQKERATEDTGNDKEDGEAAARRQALEATRKRALEEHNRHNDAQKIIEAKRAEVAKEKELAQRREEARRTQEKQKADAKKAQAQKQAETETGAETAASGRPAQDKETQEQQHHTEVSSDEPHHVPPLHRVTDDLNKDGNANGAQPQVPPPAQPRAPSHLSPANSRAQPSGPANSQSFSSRPSTATAERPPSAKTFPLPPKPTEHSAITQQPDHDDRMHTGSSRRSSMERNDSPSTNQVEVMNLFRTQIEMMGMITKLTNRNDELQQSVADLERKDTERETQMKEMEARILSSSETAVKEMAMQQAQMRSQMKTQMGGYMQTVDELKSQLSRSEAVLKDREAKSLQDLKAKEAKSVEDNKARDAKVLEAINAHKQLSKSVQEYHMETNEFKNQSNLQNIKLDNYLTSSAYRLVELDNKIKEAVKKINAIGNTYTDGARSHNSLIQTVAGYGHAIKALQDAQTQSPDAHLSRYEHRVRVLETYTGNLSRAVENLQGSQQPNGLDAILNEVKKFEERLALDKQNELLKQQAKDQAEAQEKQFLKSLGPRLNAVEVKTKENSDQVKSCVLEQAGTIKELNELVHSMNAQFNQCLKDVNKEVDQKCFQMKQLVGEQYRIHKKELTEKLDSLWNSRKNQDSFVIKSSISEKFNALKSEIEKLATSHSSQFDNLRNQFVRKFEDLRVEMVRRDNESNGRVQNYRSQMDAFITRIMEVEESVNAARAYNASSSNSKEYDSVKREIDSAW